ncbi:NADP-dependent oxidoreductase [Kitasatospora aureofaciens]|uniref:NADP-dependent oxidoreductase n=2 Tax=Kitasatospora aureofaciens TaxID=1894 RepID=A0A1E7MY84_KITAU|nr:NADP-dependent oxidoreductase [Kitasatospora aureofaciens]ARF80509.1 NADP-dependent oxidoreductase [Kitasatospora aureofaciens]OEV33405.1 NADP-dependent oxidoreductase [Kitasatospora aureofaciens]GGU59676.1 NADP-dependent oxidoreductase [Kitasatospora aureofaciens]
MAEQAAPATAREWHLAARPQGWPVPADFALVEAPVRTPGPGEILVRNTHLSVDPYMRGRMNDVKSYVPPFQLGRAMDGGAVGYVVASEAEGFAPGDAVLHGLGWREYATLDAKHAVKVDPEAAPLSAYLGVLGMPGLTAYAGLLAVGGLKEGDKVFVSGAAGAVGSLVGQIAKLKGASLVVGSAGSAEKVAKLVDEYGFDAAFNYKDAPVAEQLAKAAPEGIDLYFDNVGGDHLEAAIGALGVHGRAVLCGAIAQYNETTAPAAPRNLAMAIGKRLRLEGMLVRDHAALQPQFVTEVAGWLRSGELRTEETVVDGFENAAQAFIDLLRGVNTGKMVVRLDG